MNKVLFFAHLRDAVGEEFLKMDASGKTVGELKAELASSYDLPKLDAVMTAVNEEFAQDDGEPPGTAGQPILNQLKSAGLSNSGLIVVRYYGGTNLGKGGLIDAYGHTAGLCITKAPLKTVRATKLYKVQYTYNQQNLIEKWKNDYQLIEKEAEYLEKVTLILACPVEPSSNFLNSLQNSSHLITFFEELGNGFELR
jgi:putative IMPACT (imprinted ancient) family translation regulator